MFEFHTNLFNFVYVCLCELRCFEEDHLLGFCERELKPTKINDFKYMHYQRKGIETGVRLAHSFNI